MRIVAVAAQTIRWSIAGDGAARGRRERAAVLLEVSSDRGATGLGEAAPLPGMSIDTLDQAERAIAAFAGLAPFEIAGRDPAILGESPPWTALATSQARSRRDRDAMDAGARDVPHAGKPRAHHPGAPRGPQARAPDAVAPASDFAATPVAGRLLPFEIVDRNAAHMLATAPPAARFALETALCDAIARDRGISLATLLGTPERDGAATGTGSSTLPDPRDQARPSPRTVPLAAVIDDPEAARRAYAAGIRCFKIKLGADDSLDRVRDIAAAAPGARLRIDANRSWPRAGVAARLAALADLPIDYVEEPCRDAHLLLRAAPLACKLALDESLPALSGDDLVTALRSPQLAAVILKPTLLGGLSAALEIAALAGRSGVAAVASHALEGPIGTAACAELALALAADHPTSPAVRGVTSPAGRAIHPPVGLASHSALAAWRIAVEQLAADHVRAAAAPGLGFVDLDLAGVVRACSDRIPDEGHPP